MADDNSKPDCVFTRSLVFWMRDDHGTFYFPAGTQAEIQETNQLNQVVLRPAGRKDVIGKVLMISRLAEYVRFYSPLERLAQALD